jgi:tight adherence protein C
MDLIFSPLTVSLLTTLTLLMFLMALRPSKKSQSIESRLETFLERGKDHSLSDLGDIRGSFIERVLAPVSRRVLQMLGRLAPAQTLEQIDRQLTVAGRPGKLAAADFLGLRILILVGGLGLGLFYGSRMAAGNPRLALIGPLAGAALGYMLPNSWLQGQIRRRKETIQRALPDALDMLTICVEAGLAFESALQRVHSQWGGALSEEFGRVVAEIRLGVPRSQALRRLAQRCDLPDVASFVAVLVQADSMGTSIATVLHSQADQMRVLRRQRAEEKANTAPIKMLIPMLIFIFPALFVVILGPAIPRVIEELSSMGGK